MRVGIDLGTTFSVAAYCDEKGEPHIIPNRDGTNTTPSVVMFDEGEVLVGQQAKENAQLAPGSVASFIKRKMGDQNFLFKTDEGAEYTPVQISARILKRIRDDCESALNEDVTEAVITVPAYFKDAHRMATIQAGVEAGLNVLKIINEPTAAAIAYGIGKSAPQKVMIYDLGGGTFDVTVLEISNGNYVVRGSDGNSNLGGYDFDSKLLQYVSKKFKDMTNIEIADDPEAYQALLINCEKAKIALSSREKYPISVSAQGSKRVKIEITREEFEKIINPLIIETEVNIDEALNSSGLSVRDIDKVLLVGGSTRIPLVRQFVEQKMHQKPSCELNADEAVALGAAIYANSIDSKPGTGSGPDPQRPVITDVNSHGMGVVANNEFGIAANNIIIPKNQQIPCFGAEIFETAAENQTMIHLQITQGDDEDLSYVSIIGSSEISIRPHPKGSPVRIELGYDANGIVTGRVFDMVDNEYCGDIVIKRESDISEEELQREAMKIKSESIQ